MASLSRLLVDHTDELVQRWYETWREVGPASPELTEAALKDSLPIQLRAIGEAMREGGSSREAPHELWKKHERLAPEKRVSEEVPIEEMVREYGYVVETVHAWLEARDEQVSFAELSFFHLAIFELTAESARRYARYQAAQVARERSEYLAGIAHQMRTPLSTLKLHVRQLERGQAKPDIATLERLRRTVARLGRLVEGILRMERFLPDEMPVHPEVIYPAQVIDQLVQDYEHDAISKGLRLEVTANRSAHMVADPDLLVDALGNLIQNAIKYTQEGFVRIALEERAEEVVFRVEDSGPGISAERQRELFRPVTPEHPGGAGLGLTIAWRAAVAQGGALELESQPGSGSTFLLRLPWTGPARKAQAAVRSGEGACTPP